MEKCQTLILKKETNKKRPSIGQEKKRSKRNTMKRKLRWGRHGQGYCTQPAAITCLLPWEIRKKRIFREFFFDIFRDLFLTHVF
ncbi:hypothetical protein QL285_025585 [Trifolium repens]|nr:hypothetical protein QL285_025585 [Trifolium repens]